jgi:hypothetical protein
MNALRIAAIALLSVCFAAAQTPATTQPATANQTSVPVVKGPVLEFANANSAKIAWTSDQASTMGMHYGTDRNNLSTPVGDVDTASNKNHRASLTNLQPNTTYYFQLWTTSGTPQALGPVYSFKTPAQGQQPIHEQMITPAQ